MYKNICTHHISSQYCNENKDFIKNGGDGQVHRRSGLASILDWALGRGRGKERRNHRESTSDTHSVLLPWHLEVTSSLPDYISGADSVELTDGDIVVG